MDSETDGILEAFRRSPTYREALAEAERQQLAKRQSLVDRNDQLAIEGPAAAKPLQAAEDAARQKVEKAQAAFDLAKQELAAARSASMSQSIALDSERAALKRELLDTADPRIHQFALEMEEAFQRERHLAVSFNREVTDQFRPSDPGMHRIVEVTSNAAVKRQRLEALRAARTVALEELPYLALDPDQVAARLKQLRDSLPAEVR